MSYLNSVSITVSSDDLEEIKVKHYPEMMEKYCLMIGDIALWFSCYEDFKKFSLGVQNGFGKTLKKQLAKVG